MKCYRKMKWWERAHLDFMGRKRDMAQRRGVIDRGRSGIGEGKRGDDTS
jgi:hypothetical protein